VRTLKAATVLILVYGLAVVLNGLYYVSWSGDWSQFPRAAVRMGGTVLIAYELWRARRWAWWLATIVTAIFVVSGAVGLYVGLSLGIFEGRPNPILDLLFFIFITLLLIAILTLLLLPSTRRVVARKGAMQDGLPVATPTDQAYRLAGMVLAHAAWSVSDLSEGEFLVPPAMFERAGRRRLVRFAAENNAVATALAMAAMEEARDSKETWAFAWEEITLADAERHALRVRFWAPGMKSQGTLSQQFRPAYYGEFQLIGEIDVALTEESLSAEEEGQARARVEEGIRSHPQGSRFWDSRT
jgi:hypothetical protein